jgi:ubiquinone/menaquinone biosynthesis C-methylase UbiE
MNDIKQEWLRTQLHWDDRDAIQSRRVPKSVVFNWRKMTYILRCLCEEKYISQGHKLLMVDVGCGAGRFYDGLDSAVDLYIGIDPSDRMLLRISGGCDQFFIRGVGERLPLQSGIADVVLLKSVLDQCYAPHQVISESYRVLKDNGWLLVSLSNRRAYYALFRNLYSRLRRHKSMSLNVGERLDPSRTKDRHFFQESHQFYFDMMDILAMLSKERFEIVRQIPIGYFVFPRCLEWLTPGQLLLRCIDLADKVGAAVLPRRSGGFIFAGQHSENEQKEA